MIYLDHAATTAPDKRTVEKIVETAQKYPGNPSSSHSFGQQAKKIIEDARISLAKILNCSPEEFIFTGSGSEANNLALRGLVKSLICKGEKKIEILTSQFEHKSILETTKELSFLDQVRINYLKPNKNCQITTEAVRKAITNDLRLISIMLVNNELGVVQPIKKIGKLIEKVNSKRTEQNKIYFHSDAVQGFEYLDFDVKELHVDLLSISAHKFYGPKGIGGLFVKQNTPLKPLISGGDQELGLRAGTENTPLIAGMAAAAQSAEKNRVKNNQKVTKIRKYFEDQLRNKIDNITINCQNVKRAPHISSVSFKDCEGESILLALDLAGIAVSTGSACAAHDLKISHVLRSISLSPAQSQSTIRFSFGKDNNKKEIDRTIKELIKIIRHLRKISPK